MCGRFTLKTPAPQLAELFVVSSLPQLSPRFNVAPGQSVLCVRASADGDPARTAVLMRWGLVPFWAKDPSIGNRMINARSETVARKPAFRQAFARRRCLIPADGFYEWQKLGGRKRQPWYLHSPHDAPFAFAGLWESWNAPESDDVLETCTIVTTAATPDLQGLHERMPVILTPDQHAVWLSDSASSGQLTGLMTGLPEETLVRYPVSSLVNAVVHDQPACLDPVEIQPDEQEKPVSRQRSLFD